MTDLATLAIKVDSTQAGKAASDLDKLTASGRKAEVQTDALGREWVKASSAAGKLRLEQLSASNAASKMAADAQAAAARVTGMGNSGKLASHQIQNLTFQLNDMIVGLASGQKPMTVFMQQGAQIGQIMGQAGIGVKGLASELGGMVSRVASAHPYLAAFAAVVAVAAGSMKIFAMELNDERRAELDAYANSLGLTKKEMEDLGPITVGLSDVLTGLGKTFQQEFGISMPSILDGFKKQFFAAFDSFMTVSRMTTSAIYAGFVGTFNGVKETWSSLPAILGEATVGAANLVIRALNYLLQKGTQYINAWSSAINGVLGAIPGFEGTKIGNISAPQIAEISNQFAGAGKSAAGAFMNAYSAAFNQAEGVQKRIGREIADNTIQSAKDRFHKAAQDKGFLDAEDAKKAGAKAGKAAGDAFVAAMLKALNNDFLQAIVDVEKKTKEILGKALTKDWADIQAEIAARTKDASDATVDWNEELRKTVDYLDQIGGKASGLGDIAAAIVGLTSGDFSGVQGKGGALFKQLMGIQWTTVDDQGRMIHTLRDEIVKGLDQVFGGDGAFAKTMNGLLQGAGTGIAIGGIMGGGKTAQIGSALGGAAGQAIGSSIAALGSAGGPIGAVVGAIAGNLLGSLLTKTKKGIATFGDSGLVSTGGNSSSRTAGATQSGNAAMDAFNQLLDQLGATASGISFSTGIRNKNFTLDPSGSGATKGAGVLNFGQDQEAFLKATLKEILSDATFTGISEGVQRLLKGDGDVEKQLQKALGLQNVFNDLAQRKDGQAFDLSALDKEFAKLRDIATEAGEGMVQVEELYGLKRQEIIDKYAADAVEKTRGELELRAQVLAMEGKIDDAKAITRYLELAGLNEAEKAMRTRLYQLQDEAEIIARNKAIADERYGLETQLYQVLGDQAKLQERQLATLDPTNQALQQHIWALEAQKTATEEAAKAAEDLANTQKAIADEAKGIELQIMQLRGDTAGLRANELAGLNEANRARMEYLYNLQDEIAAQTEAAAAAKARADERDGLMTQWLQAIGDEASLRARALEKIDPTNRALQQQIWAYEDAQKAMQAEIAARNDQISAIEQTASALQSAQDKWLGFAKDIREFRAGLFNPTKGSGISYAQARADFERTSRMAALGNESSLQNFTGVSQTFLDAAMQNAKSLVDYQRALGLVAGASDAAAAGAEGVANQAADQYAALQQQIAELQALNANATIDTPNLASVADVQANDVVPTLEQLVREMQASADTAAAVRAEEKAEAVSTISLLSEQNSYFRQIIEAGMVKVLVSNTATEPVLVDQIP